LGLLGISGGVLAGAIYDDFVNGIDHNLFSFEIVIMAVLIEPSRVSRSAQPGITSFARGFLRP
jgi:hypothetical protein